MSVDMSAEAVSARLRRVGEISDLSPERRLEGKIDMSAEAVSARLREVADLLEACLALARARDR